MYGSIFILTWSAKPCARCSSLPAKSHFLNQLPFSMKAFLFQLVNSRSVIHLQSPIGIRLIVKLQLCTPNTLAKFVWPAHCKNSTLPLKIVGQGNILFSLTPFGLSIPTNPLLVSSSKSTGLLWTTILKGDDSSECDWPWLSLPVTPPHIMYDNIFYLVPTSIQVSQWCISCPCKQKYQKVHPHDLSKMYTRCLTVLHVWNLDSQKWSPKSEDEQLPSVWVSVNCLINFC